MVWPEIPKYLVHPMSLEDNPLASMRADGRGNTQVIPGRWPTTAVTGGAMNRNKSRMKDLAYSLFTTLAAGLVVAAVAGAGLYVMSRHQIPATSDRKTAPPDLRKENAPGGEA